MIRLNLAPVLFQELRFSDNQNSSYSLELTHGASFSTAQNTRLTEIKEQFHDQIIVNGTFVTATSEDANAALLASGFLSPTGQERGCQLDRNGQPA